MSALEDRIRALAPELEQLLAEAEDAWGLRSQPESGSHYEAFSNFLDMPPQFMNWHNRVAPPSSGRGGR